MKSNLLLIVLASSLLMSCSEQSTTTAPAKRINADIDSSMKANANATTHIEWEASDSHPEVIFQKWHAAGYTESDVCPVLEQRTDDELAVLEEEIRKADNADLVKDCKDQLLARIAKYLDIPHPVDGKYDNQVSFDQRVITKDFKKGGFNYTLNLPKNTFMLSFDDGPHPEYTKQILDTLKAANVKAVFFEMGKNVNAHPEITKMVAAAGEEIGSHSVTHACLADNKICNSNNVSTVYKKKLTYKQAVAEINGGAQAIFKVLGWIDPYFRFPYGEATPELKQYLVSKSVGEFYWNLDSNDWRKGTPTELVNYVMDQTITYNHGIILFHDIQHRTAIALPEILKEFYLYGYNLVILRPSDPKARLTSGLVQGVPAAKVPTSKNTAGAGP